MFAHRRRSLTSCLNTRLQLRRLEERVTPVTTQWLGNSVSMPQVWTNSINWSMGVPDGDDVALFTAKFGGVNVPNAGSTLDAPFTIAALVVESSYPGGLFMNSALITTGSSNVDSASVQIFAGGSWENQGTLAINANLAVTGSLINKSLVNQGATANVTLATPAVITNQSMATWDIQGDGDVDWIVGAMRPTFTNQGLIRKSAGLTTSFIEGNVNIEGGTIDVQSGTLDLQTGGTSTGGTFNVSMGAVLDISSGATPTYGGTYTGAGAGTIRWDGTTNGTADLKFNFPGSLLQWTGANLVTGTLTNVGTINLVSGAMAASTLINQGTITHGSGNLNISTGSSIVNDTSGTWHFSDIGDISWVSGATRPPIINRALILKSVDTGTCFIEGDYSNEAAGTITVNTGRLDLLSGGTSTGGTFNVAASATLDITGGATPTYEGTYTGTGGGTILWDGSLKAGAGLSFNFPAPLLQWNGGTLSDGAMTNLNTIQLTSGTLSATASVTNKATLRHSTGGLNTVTGSSIVNDTGATWEFTGDGDINFVSGATTPSIINRALIRKSGGTLISIIEGNFQNEPAGVITVDTGTIDLQSNGVSTGGTFNVAMGAVLDLATTRIPTYQGTYTGTGAGTVRWDATMSAGTGWTLNFPAPMFLWAGGALNGGSITNTGTIQFTSGSMAAGTTLTNKSSFLHGGNLNYVSGSSIVNDTGGTWDYQGDGDVNWVSGAVAPPFVNRALIRKSGGAAVSILEGAFQNEPAGVITVETGTLDLNSNGTSTGGTFNVSPGAILDLATTRTPTYEGLYTGTGGGTVRWDATITAGANFRFNFPAPMLQWNVGTLSNGTLTNLGTIALTSGTLSSTAGFINQGIIQHGAGSLNYVTGSTILNQTGATWDFVGDGDIDWVSGATAPTFTNRGLIRKTGGIATSFIEGDWANLGIVDVQVKTLQSTTGPFTNPGGTINVASGATFDTPSTLDVSFGTLRGSGTVTDPVNNSAGFVRPGTSPGKLSTTGNFTQGANGNLFVEINGLMPGTQYDQLAVTGTVTLAGKLSVSMGFSPALNDSFVIIDNDSTDKITGTFTGLAEGGTFKALGTTFTITYKGGTDANDVVLTATTVDPTPAPLVQAVVVNNNAPQRSRVDRVDVTFDQIVTLPTNPADAFQLQRQIDGSKVGLAVSVDNSGNGSVVTLTFINIPFTPVEFGSLADGKYTLTIFAVMVGNANGLLDGDANGSGGDNFFLLGNTIDAPKLYRFFGDSDGDGDVDNTDFLRLRATLNQPNTSPAFLSYFDFEQDGDVDNTDFLRFRNRLNMPIP